MLVQSLIILVITLECRSLRKQFNHYQEFLEKQALRAKKSTAKEITRDPMWKGPNRTLNYNPTFGYEPYWKTGDWVFLRKKPESVKDQSLDCGHNCDRIYKRYGKICARNKTGSFMNFSSICAMNSYDCTGLEGWMVAHRGDCKGEYGTFPTLAGNDLWYSQYPATRAVGILNAFKERYTNLPNDPDYI